MKDVKLNMKLDFAEPHARVRVMMLHTDYLNLCELHRSNFVYIAPKIVVKDFIAVLQPLELENQIYYALK